LGPIGWTILGAIEDVINDASNDASSGFTFDCWKPVVHDETTEPSQGKFLRDIMEDSRMKNVVVVDNNVDNDNNDGQGLLPLIVLENVWNEKFRVDFVMLPSKVLAAHAVLID
jgi:hypothetical protein